MEGEGEGRRGRWLSREEGEAGEEEQHWGDRHARERRN